MGMRLVSVFLPTLLLLGALFVPSPVQAAGPATACVPMPPFGSPHDRFGVNVLRDYGKSAADYRLAQMHVGWYLDYTVKGAPNSGVAYVRVLRVEDLIDGNWEDAVEEAVLANPGALWFIGNEVDRYSQDGIPAEDYARVYHKTYTLIKQLDPTAMVGNAALIQPTPLRLRYLDTFVRTYRELYHTKPPVDYWNMHNFILREEGGNWGASLPPGLEAFDDEGMRFEVWEHGDIERFKAQIITFRQWMADNDYRNVPLTVSEYGILMPADFFAEPPLADGSFPPNARRYDPAFVGEFMMATFDFFLGYTDPAIGYPQDENRLVQSWAWYSLNDLEFDRETETGSNGNWVDHDSGALTPIGQDFAAFTAPLYNDYRDLAMRRAAVTSAAVMDPENPGVVEVEAWVQNRGTLPSANATVRLYWERGPGDRVLIDEQVVQAVAERCSHTYKLQFTWQPDSLPLGQQVLVAEVSPASDQPEGVTGNESAVTTLRVGAPGTFPEVHLPLVMQ